MLRASLAPTVHLFVCANRRPPDSPLGPGCGDAGALVFSAMKSEVLRAGRAVDAWVTQTQCLGICPKRGATVAIYPQQDIWSEVEVADVPALLAPALSGARSDR